MLQHTTRSRRPAPPPPPPPTQTSWQVQASLHPTLALAPSSTPRPTHTQPRSRPVRRTSSGVAAAATACEGGQDYRKGMVSPSPPTTTHSTTTTTTATSSAPSAASSPSSTVSRPQTADVPEDLDAAWRSMSAGASIAPRVTATDDASAAPGVSVTDISGRDTKACDDAHAHARGVAVAGVFAYTELVALDAEREEVVMGSRREQLHKKPARAAVLDDAGCGGESALASADSSLAAGGKGARAGASSASTPRGTGPGCPEKAQDLAVPKRKRLTEAVPAVSGHDDGEWPDGGQEVGAVRGAGAAAALAVSPEGANAKVEDVTQVRVTGTGVQGAGGMRARVERSGADGRLARHTSSRTIPSVSTGEAGASSDNAPPAAWQRGRREKEQRNCVQQTPAQLGPPRAKATASCTGGKREWRGGQELKGAVLGWAGGITGGGRTLTVQEGVTEVPIRKWGSTVWFSLPDLRL